VRDELSKACQLQSTAQDKVIHLEQLQLTFKDNLDAKSREIKFLTTRLDSREQELRREFDERYSQLSSNLQTVHKELNSARQTVSDLTARGLQDRSEHQTALARAKESEQAAVRRVDKDRAELEVRRALQSGLHNSLEFSVCRCSSCSNHCVVRCG
jgi:predicted  nucleic acid-binding Zn-ribbon protein